MICPNCNGTGFVRTHTIVPWKRMECDLCDGTGVVEPLTNDEWRRTCSAEEFANFLNNTTYDAWFAGRENEMPKIKGLRKWDSWLKEKHE